MSEENSYKELEEYLKQVNQNLRRIAAALEKLPIYESHGMRYLRVEK